ncbi:MAG: glycosyltransferase, partial [Dictyoglomus sp.]
PKEIAQEKLQLPKDGILLLFVGRLGKEKNIEYLIKVISYLKRISKSLIYLIIVGDNPDKRVLEGLKDKAKKEKVEDRVIFTGYLDYEKVITVYYASDIFVFSSLTETQGLVVLEALSAGLPVIALEDEAISDFVKNEINGFLIPWKDGLEKSIKIFSDRIITLLENRSLYNTLSQNALETSRNFHIKKINQKLISLYNDLLKGYNIINA